MLTILVITFSIWPFVQVRNHSLDWYERRLQHSKQQRITHRQHKQSWLTNNR